MGDVIEFPRAGSVMAFGVGPLSESDREAVEELTKRIPNVTLYFGDTMVSSGEGVLKEKREELDREMSEALQQCLRDYEDGLDDS